MVILFIGLGSFGAATAAGLQARFAATEVGDPARTARSMSVVLWATTIGSIAGPNLSELGSAAGQAIGIEPLTGPYLFSFVAFAGAMIIIALGLRPRHLQVEKIDTVGPAPMALGRALRIGLATPGTRLAIVAITCSHTIMVEVMVMTPVHMHHLGFSLGLVGLVISIHIFGMYGASPVMGWLTDRFTAGGVLLIGAGFFVAALALAALADHPSMLLISLALGLLGLGWSAGMIAGSSLLTVSLPAEAKVSVQGATDAVMNLSAAGSAALSGLILGWGGYPALAGVAAVFVVPMLGLTLRELARRAPVRRDPVRART